MLAVQPRPLGQQWKERLALSARKPPELYESPEIHANNAEVTSTPHARAIRMTLDDLNASAVFCIQAVPTVTILLVDDYDRSAIVDLHGKLWNQGLSNLLLILSGDIVRAFSLARIPHRNDDEGFERRCLVRALNAATEASKVRSLIYGAESGRLWEDDRFKPEERIDRVLLDNLKESYERLRDEKLSSDHAQALLMQSMFVAYLEDRKVIRSDYVRNATRNSAGSFLSILASGNVRALDLLFAKLRNHFNGDLFVAPCSFDTLARQPTLKPSHLDILARFRSGHQEMITGQYRFWGYDFKYMPIELISAVYDRFLGEEEDERRNRGAYYTPRFVADMTLSQIGDRLPKAKIQQLSFLDPACGSGIFLVRTFQFLCEHWRATKDSAKIQWSALLAILSRLRGWDVNGSSVRVAVFALYIALLEEVEDADLQALIERSNLLPKLWGRSLRQQDFFAVEPDDHQAQADVIVGNPPWKSRREAGRHSVKWCTVRGLPIPSGEEAWGFVWKSLTHLRKGGVVAFLLPAMGFLHNNSQPAVAARRRLLNDARVYRIANLADLRFQLFDGAVRPAALIVYGHGEPEGRPYQIEYLTPKADLNLKNRRLIALSRADKCFLASPLVQGDPSIFKRFLWISEPEEKLFHYLSSFPRLGDLNRKSWPIGQGFQARNRFQPIRSAIVGRIPHLPIEQFVPLVQRTEQLSPWPSGIVHRRGFERGFYGPRVLVPKGVHTAAMRLRATYVEEPATFRDSIRAILVPRGEESRAKLLTVLLNSRVAIWFAFHGTSSFGADRPQVMINELLLLPFPPPEVMPERGRAQFAAEKMISLMDERMQLGDSGFGDGNSRVFEEIDRLAYEFFCLTDEEIVLVEDTVGKILRGVQPSRGSVPEMWLPSSWEERREYAHALLRRMRDWFDSEYSVAGRLEARNDDVGILRLSLQAERMQPEYCEVEDSGVGEILADLSGRVGYSISGNVYSMADTRIFVENYLYFVKPMQKRFWLRSTAQADADSIALDLQDSVGRQGKQTDRRQ